MLTDDESLSAEEKIKHLVEFEEEKRKELDEKRAELEERRKELEQLEKKGQKEIKTAREEIEEKIEELALEEKKRFEELEELRRKREAEASLEETVEKEEKEGRAQPVPGQRGYGEIVQEILQGAPSFYDITNYNVVNELERIAGEAGNRPLTEKEKEFIGMIQYHAEKFGKDDFYKNKDESNYLSKELAKIDQIQKTAKDANIMKGEYDI